MYVILDNDKEKLIIENINGEAKISITSNNFSGWNIFCLANDRNIDEFIGGLHYLND